MQFPLSAPNRRFTLWTLAALLLLTGWDAGGLDLPAARLLAGSHGFALQNHWLLTEVLHQGVLPPDVNAGWPVRSSPPAVAVPSARCCA